MRVVHATLALSRAGSTTGLFQRQVLLGETGRVLRRPGLDVELGRAAGHFMVAKVSIHRKLEGREGRQKKPISFEKHRHTKEKGGVGGPQGLTVRVLGDVLAVRPRGVAGVLVAHVAGRRLALWLAWRAGGGAARGLGADVAGGVAADLADVAVAGELAALADGLRGQGLGGDSTSSLSDHGGVLAEGDLRRRIAYQHQRAWRLLSSSTPAQLTLVPSLVAFPTILY